MEYLHCCRRFFNAIKFINFCLTSNSLGWLWMEWANNIDKHQTICELLRHFWDMIKLVKRWREPISATFKAPSIGFERLILIDFKSIHAIHTPDETVRCFSLLYLCSLKVNFQNVCVLCICRAVRWFLRQENRLDIPIEFLIPQRPYIWTGSWMLYIKMKGIFYFHLIYFGQVSNTEVALAKSR